MVKSAARLCLIGMMVVILLAASVGAAEITYRLDSSDSPTNAWEALRDGLPEELRDELDGVDLDDPAAAARAVGEKADMRFWADRIGDALRGAVDALLPTLAPLVPLILLSAAAEAAIPAFSPGLTAAFSNFTRLLTALTVFRTAFGVLEAAEAHLGQLCSFMNLMTPVMQAAYLAEGSLTQASLASSSLMLAVTVLADANTYLLTPVIRALLTLSAAAMVCPEVKFTGLVAAVRKLALRLWALMTLFFSFFLGSQTVLAKSADDLAAKTAKFALGSFVPMAGGLLSEAFGTVRAGMRLLRMTAGIGGILVLLLLLLPGIVPLAVYRLMLSLAGTAAELLGLSGTAALLAEVRGIAELLTAAVLGTGLLFLLAVMLFAGGSGA